MAQGLKVYALGFRVLRVLGFKVFKGFSVCFPKIQTLNPKRPMNSLRPPGALTYSPPVSMVGSYHDRGRINRSLYLSMTESLSNPYHLL